MNDHITEFEQIQQEAAKLRREREMKNPPPLKDRAEGWILLVIGIFALIGFVSIGDAIDHWRGKIPTCERITSARERVESLKFHLSEAGTEIHHTQTTEADKESLRERIRQIERELSNLDTHLERCNCPEP